MARCSRVCRHHASSAATSSSTSVDSGRAGHHRVHSFLVPGTSTNTMARHRSGTKAVSELRSSCKPLLLGQPIGSNAAGQTHAPGVVCPGSRTPQSEDHRTSASSARAPTGTSKREGVLRHRRSQLQSLLADAPDHRLRKRAQRRRPAHSSGPRTLAADRLRVSPQSAEWQPVHGSEPDSDLAARSATSTTNSAAQSAVESFGTICSGLADECRLVRKQQPQGRQVLRSASPGGQVQTQRRLDAARAEASKIRSAQLNGLGSGTA